VKYFLIFNPTAHQGKSGKSFDKILRLLKEKEVSFSYAATSRKDEAIELASKAVRERWDVIVAAGGDGTISEVTTGMLNEAGKGNRSRLGVLHIGTSPDFNRYHNIPVKIEDAVEALIQGKTRLIDIGKITYLGSFDGEACSGSLGNHKDRKTAYFSSNVNIGLGPQIASKANGRYREYLGDVLGTLSSTLVSLVRFKGFDLNVEIDGTKRVFRRVLNLTIGKDPYLASGMRVFNAIEPDDGRLYFLSIGNCSKLSLVANLWRLYLGNFLECKGVELDYCKAVKIHLNERCPEIEFDGDLRGYLPATVEVIPKGLEVVVGG
jgi:YegS/Rv2252/BmrU family lipid kinase